MYSLKLEDDRTIHFLAMPKTASRAISTWMQARPGCVRDAGHHSIHNFDERYQEGDIVITTVRNHWDWFVSWYYHNGWCQQRGTSFEEFLLECVEKPVVGKPWSVLKASEPGMSRLFYRYTPLATHILHFESFKKEFEDIVGQEVQLLHVGGKERKGMPYQEVYNEVTRQLVADRFAKEIDFYVYSY